MSIAKMKKKKSPHPVFSAVDFFYPIDTIHPDNADITDYHKSFYNRCK